MSVTDEVIHGKALALQLPPVRCRTLNPELGDRGSQSANRGTPKSLL